jgi:hypothetical protein
MSPASGHFPTPFVLAPFDLKNDYERAYGWKGNTIYESETALFFECMR